MASSNLDALIILDRSSIVKKKKRETKRGLLAPR